MMQTLKDYTLGRNAPLTVPGFSLDPHDALRRMQTVVSLDGDPEAGNTTFLTPLYKTRNCTKQGTLEERDHFAHRLKHRIWSDGILGSQIFAVFAGFYQNALHPHRLSALHICPDIVPHHNNFLGR